MAGRAAKARMRKLAQSKIHTNVLKPALTDVLTLGKALHERFVQIFEDWFRVKHEQLELPHELDADVVLWRTAVVRFTKGDYRCTADEYWAMTRVADWTLVIRAELTSTEVKKVDWQNPW